MVELTMRVLQDERTKASFVQLIGVLSQDEDVSDIVNIICFKIMASTRIMLSSLY
jgi:hypothetical protein